MFCLINGSLEEQQVDVKSFSVNFLKTCQVIIFNIIFSSIYIKHPGQMDSSQIICFTLYTVKSDTLKQVDLSIVLTEHLLPYSCSKKVIFHITPSSCQLLVQLDIDISTSFKVSLFTVYL